MLALRRIAVGVDDEIVVSVVRCLERRARLDVDQPPGRYVVPFGWLPDVHRQGAGHDDECLLLGAVPMTASPCTWFVAPDVRACVREPRSVAQFGHVPRRFAGLVWPGDPVERSWLDDAEAHAGTLGAEASEEAQLSFEGGRGVGAAGDCNHERRGDPGGVHRERLVEQLLVVVSIRGSGGPGFRI